MASTRGSSDMKGFYRQKKQSGGIAKQTKKSSPNHSASLGSNLVQPPTLVSHGSPDLNEDCDAKEEVLRSFDMNMAYGPCLGMTRLDRWERAKSLGLNPPKDVESLLKASKVRNECLWDGRV